MSSEGSWSPRRRGNPAGGKEDKPHVSKGMFGIPNFFGPPLVSSHVEKQGNSTKETVAKQDVSHRNKKSIGRKQKTQIAEDEAPVAKKQCIGRQNQLPLEFSTLLVT